MYRKMIKHQNGALHTQVSHTDLYCAQQKVNKVNIVFNVQKNCLQH